MLFRSALCAVRNTEAHLRWLGAQLGLFLNLPAFAGVGLRLLATSSRWELSLICFGSGVFVFGNFFLLHVLRRDTKQLNFQHDKLAELETTNKIEGGVQIFSSEQYARIRNSKDRLQTRLDVVMIACIVGWEYFLMQEGAESEKIDFGSK